MEGADCFNEFGRLSCDGSSRELCVMTLWCRRETSPKWNLFLDNISSDTVFKCAREPKELVSLNGDFSALSHLCLLSVPY